MSQTRSIVRGYTTSWLVLSRRVHTSARPDVLSRPVLSPRGVVQTARHAASRSLQIPSRHAGAQRSASVRAALCMVADGWPPVHVLSISLGCTLCHGLRALQAPSRVDVFCAQKPGALRLRIHCAYVRGLVPSIVSGSVRSE